MQKLKPVIPSLREKKRYVAFEVLSSKSHDVQAVAQALKRAVLGFVGELGLAKAGMVVLTDNYNPASKRGIVRVSHASLDALKASFTFITAISGIPTSVRSVTASGSIAKARAAIA